MASVPMLPNVVNPLKDAACAAKETVGQVVHVPDLVLRGDEFEVEDYYNGPLAYIYFIEVEQTIR